MRDGEGGVNDDDDTDEPNAHSAAADRSPRSACEHDGPVAEAAPKVRRASEAAYAVATEICTDAAAAAAKEVIRFCVLIVRVERCGADGKSQGSRLRCHAPRGVTKTPVKIEAVREARRDE